MFRRIAISAPAAATRISAVSTAGRRSYHEKDMQPPRPIGCTCADTRILIDHYSNPRNVGSMPKTDLDVGTGLVGAPACTAAPLVYRNSTETNGDGANKGGDVMKLQIRVDSTTNTISDVKFKTFGCGSAIASSSYLTELVRGMSLDDAGRIKNTEIAKELCLPPVKLHCSMLAEDAIKSAIKDYRAKTKRAATSLGSVQA